MENIDILKDTLIHTLKNTKKKVVTVIDPDTLVKRITPTFISDALEKLLYNSENELSNKYVQVVKSKLGSMFHYAVNKKYILVNPVDNVKVNWKQHNSSTKIRDKFLEQSELKLLLNYAYQKNLRYALLIEWLYLTGMRVGEALALHWDDIINTL